MHKNYHGLNFLPFVSPTDSHRVSHIGCEVTKNNRYCENYQHNTAKILSIHGNFYSNPFYYNIGDTLTGAGIDFIYAQTNDAFGAIRTQNVRTGREEIIGSWNERFALTDEDVAAYLDYAERLRVGDGTSEVLCLSAPTITSPMATRRAFCEISTRTCRQPPRTACSSSNAQATPTSRSNRNWPTRFCKPL